ncbi:MAG TPA: helix-turn-helix domain-containing protein [Syntrophorhabdus sp.]|nr:helix-turn-helix domain-containing protein [Syntrophorhabdus sp.]
MGNKIREIRKKTGLSMKELAKLVGVSYLTIQRIETGEASPSVAVLSEIAHCLKHPITSFFEKDKEWRVIRANEQPSVETKALSLKVLVPKAVMSDKISVSLGALRKGKRIDEHTNKGFEITYIVKGKCRQTYEKEVFELKKGDIVYFNAERPHSIYAIESIEFINIYLKQFF